MACCGGGAGENCSKAGLETMAAEAAEEAACLLAEPVPVLLLWPCVADNESRESWDAIVSSSSSFWYLAVVAVAAAAGLPALLIPLHFTHPKE